MPNLILRREDRTNPVIWLIAIVCAVLAVAVIITGLGVIVIYLIYQPRVPYLVVTDARLDELGYDQSGLLDSFITLSISAENDNVRANATFSDLRMKLRFHGIEIAELRAAPFEVEKNSSVALNYKVAATAAPLDEGAEEEMYVSLMRDLVRFELDGQARTQWRVGFVLTMKFWTHLDCELQFFVSNKSSKGLDCSSKSHSL